MEYCFNRNSLPRIVGFTPRFRCGLMTPSTATFAERAILDQRSPARVSSCLSPQDFQGLQGSQLLLSMVPVLREKFPLPYYSCVVGARARSEE